MKINENFLKLKDNYLFEEIKRRAERFRVENPGKKIISLGVGDVTRPLCPAAVKAMATALDEMAKPETFRGYLPEQGCLFLRESVCNYYKKKGISLKPGEVFISDGAANDLGNLLDIFSADNTVLIPNPTYPAYADANIMAGRNPRFIHGTAENNFLPLPDESENADIIYLCSPNNPTGAVYNKQELEKWVKYALRNKAVIIFDSAYEFFIRGKDLPSSIYQIEGADECAIEICSFSKTAGFSGIRCAFTVVPEKIVRENVFLNALWLRRQTTKSNGVSYISQRGAEAILTDEGLSQAKKNIDYYLENCKIIAKTLGKAGIWYTGGQNTPYIWLKCPGEMSSWEFFDALINETAIVGTPGAGFGTSGDGFFRLSGFAKHEDIKTAMRRFKKFLANRF